MSKINELIQTLCPDGVEYKKLGELFSFKNGISKNKSFFGHGQPIINFTDVYHHVRLYSTMIKGLVDATDSELKRFGVCKGDCFFTRTSETKEDIGRASVIVDNIENCVFSGFLIKGHPITDLLMPEYCSYCFNSGDFRKTIVENANMTTRATITGEILSKIEIPVPPLPVQDEIVRILDEYTNLEAELEAKLSEEIELKQKQYEWYRDELLTMSDDVSMVSLGDIGTVCMCKRILKSQTNDIGGVPFYKIGTFGGVANAYISEELFEEYRDKYNYPKKGDILISAAGTIGRTIVFDGQPAYFQDSNIVWLKHDETKVTNRYLNCMYQMSPWYIEKGGTIARLYNDNILKAVIPVPSLEEQDKIVDSIEEMKSTFGLLISAINTELESRKKQYAYYRDQLLTFKRKE